MVLGIGSTSPGLLSYFIDKFSLVFPDYKDRVIRHGEGAVPLPWAPGLCCGQKTNALLGLDRWARAWYCCTPPHPLLMGA